MRPWHIIVVVLVFLLFFGIPKLPELARAIGRSLRIFKAETKSLMDDDVQAKSEAQTRAELSDSPDSPGASSKDSTDSAKQAPLSGDVLNSEREQR